MARWAARNADSHRTSSAPSSSSNVKNFSVRNTGALADREPGRIRASAGETTADGSSASGRSSQFFVVERCGHRASARAGA